MRDGLRHAVACSAPSYMECPSFRRLLDLAASGIIGGDDSKKSIHKQRPKALRRTDR